MNHGHASVAPSALLIDLCLLMICCAGKNNETIFTCVKINTVSLQVRLSYSCIFRSRFDECAWKTTRSPVTEAKTGESALVLHRSAGDRGHRCFTSITSGVKDSFPSCPLAVYFSTVSTPASPCLSKQKSPKQTRFFVFLGGGGGGIK